MHSGFLNVLRLLCVFQVMVAGVAHAHSCIRVIPTEHDDETLISEGMTIGMCGGPVVKFSEIDGEFACLIGGYGGFIINHAFFIGGGGYGLANDVEVDAVPYPEYRMLEMGYGGVMLGYVNRSHKVVHLAIHSLIGGGGQSYRSRYYDYWSDDYFFVVEPGLDLELNVTKHFRIALGGSYRFVQGVDLDGLTAESLNGPCAALTLKMGRF